MLKSIIPIPLATRHLAGGTLIAMLAGCAGDDLLLPEDGTLAELRLVSGDRQSAPAGDPIEDPLIVEARDGARRPVPGAVILFEFLDPPNGAELAPASTETDEAGQATAQVTLGTPPGDQSVEARVDDPDKDLSVRFRLTALRPQGGDEGGDEDEGDGGGGGGGGGGGEDGDGGDEDDGDDKGNGKGKGKGKGKD